MEFGEDFGNISGQKLPCAINAVEQNGFSANSKEGKLVSTIAIGMTRVLYKRGVL